MANGSRHLWGLLDGANDLIQITNLDGSIIYVNPAWCRASGYSPVDVNNRSMLEFLPAEVRDRYRDILQAIQTGEAVWNGAITLLTSTGQAVTLQGQMRYYQPGDSQPAEIWSLWQTATPASTQPLPHVCKGEVPAESLTCPPDPTGNLSPPDSTTLLTQQNYILKLITRGHPLTEILTELAYLIEQQAIGMLCSFLLLAEDGVTLRHGAAPSLPATYSQAIDGVTIGAAVGSCGTAVYRQERVIVTDIASDPLWVNFRQLALSHGLRACWSTPIFSAQGQVLGTFAMYYRQPRSPSAAELRLIQVSTDLASIAIDRHRAEVALHKSEERLRLALDFTGVGSWDWEIANDRLIVSDSALRLVGLAPGMVITHLTWIQLTHPEDRVGVERAIAHALATHTDYVAEYRVIHPDGSVHWLLSKGRGIYETNAQVVRMVGVVIDLTDRKRFEELLHLTNQTLDIQVETQTSRLEEALANLQAEFIKRKHIQIALQQSEMRYRAIVEDQTELVCRYLPDGTLTFVNDAYCQVVGCSRTDLLGYPHKLFLLALNNELADRLIAPPPTDQPLHWLEHQIALPNGEVRWHQWNSRAIYGDRGQLVEFQAVGRDITDRKLVEESLRRSAERLREAQRVAHIGNWEFDPLAQKIFWSEETCYILGLSPDHPAPSLPQTMACFHPSDRRAVTQAVEQTVTAGTTLSLDARIVRPDGTLRHVEIRGEASTNHQGQTIRLFGTLLDITERKVAEASLRESEERFRQLAENTDEVFFIHAPDLSKVIYVSPAYETVWQRDRASLYQYPTAWLDSIHPDDLNLVQARLHQMIQGQSAQAEYRILLPDGTTRWINARSFPIYDEAGQLQRHVGLAADVTEAKRAAAEIHKALTKEKELNELKSRFVSMISHEFRTPLTTIQSAADLLQYYEWSKAEQQERFHQIAAAVRHMTQLLEDVLLIGRADAGKLEFNPTLLNLTEFCRQLVAELQLNIGNRCQITFQVEGDRPSVWVDQKLMRQIVTNLLSNAIKYSVDWGNIEFKLAYQAEQILLHIRDQGIGVPADAQEHLFEAFYRADNVNEIQGTGLGLAIVKKCVDLYGGSITLDSKVGAGSTFTVSLPLIFY